MQLILEENTTDPGCLGDMMPDTVSANTLLTNQEMVVKKSGCPQVLAGL